jgi:hypothetical protein
MMPDLSPLKARVVELFTSNVPAGVPSYSDIGKAGFAGATTGFIVFAANSAVWILTTGASTGIFGPWSWMAALGAFIIHYGILFVQHGSEAKTDVLKAAEQKPSDGPTEVIIGPTDGLPVRG